MNLILVSQLETTVLCFVLEALINAKNKFPGREIIFGEIVLHPLPSI
jgi:hypothetical protein